MIAWTTLVNNNENYQISTFFSKIIQILILKNWFDQMNNPEFSKQLDEKYPKWFQVICLNLVEIDYQNMIACDIPRNRLYIFQFLKHFPFYHCPLYITKKVQSIELFDRYTHNRLLFPLANLLFRLYSQMCCFSR